MKVQIEPRSIHRYRFSPLYGKRIVPKPIRRYLSYFIAILAVCVLLIAYIQNTIPATIAMQGMGVVGFVYWMSQPLPIRQVRIDRNH
jgi:hypothetical protein